MMEFDDIEQFVYMWVCAGIDVDAALFRSHYVDEAVCLLGEKDVRRIRIDWRGIVCDALGHGIRLFLSGIYPIVVSAYEAFSQP